MNNGLHVVFLEVALKRPVVGKAKRDRGVSLIHGTQRNDIPAVIGVSDARERLASQDEGPRAERELRSRI